MDQTNSYTGSQTIVGYFDNADRAERALTELQSAGFTSAHLGMAHRGGSARNAAGSATRKAEHAAESAWDKIRNFFEGGPENYADERTRGDAGTRVITTPDMGSNTSYGTTAGTTSGYDDYDLNHSLTGMNIPEHRSRYFSSRFRSNHDGALVTVNAGARAAEAERILRDNGADLGDNASETADYNTREYAAGTAAGAGAYAGSDGAERREALDATTDYANRQINRDTYARPDANRETAYADRDIDRDTEYADRDRAGYTAEGLENIQLLGEVLRVHKDRINRGEVVVRKDVITETQTVQVPVTREELVVERRDVAGDTPARGAVGEGREIRIPLTEETASVDKGTVVREEVAVGKRPVQEVRDLSGEVRREELVVDDQTTNRKRAVNE
jgi:uncharacterized protein (TIGR02271 family)